MKVRDEMKITTAAYKAQYESSVVFGVRKQVQAESGVQFMENQIKEQERKKMILDNFKIEQTNELMSLEKSYQERNKHDEEKREDELVFLRYQNTHLDEFLAHVKREGDPIEVKTNITNK